MEPFTEEKLAEITEPLIDLEAQLGAVIAGRAILNNPNYTLRLSEALYAAAVNLAATVTDERFDGIRKAETVEGVFPLKVCYFSDKALLAEAADRKLPDTWSDQPGGRSILIRAIIEDHKKKIAEFGA